MARSGDWPTGSVEKRLGSYHSDRAGRKIALLPRRAVRPRARIVCGLHPYALRIGPVRMPSSIRPGSISTYPFRSLRNFCSPTFPPATISAALFPVRNAHRAASVPFTSSMASHYSFIAHTHFCIEPAFEKQCPKPNHTAFIIPFTYSRLYRARDYTPPRHRSDSLTLEKIRRRPDRRVSLPLFS